MIAPAKPVRRPKLAAAWHTAFLIMLPRIRDQARFAFRKTRPEAQEDAIAEVVAAVCVAYARLVAQGKACVACPSALTRFAVQQFRSGRRLGCKLNVKDVSSVHCQLRKHITLDRLDRRDRTTGGWKDVLLEDRHAGPAATAAARIDVHEWFQSMRPRDRRMAQALAVGERTKDVARRFRVSPGRVSQKRLEFRSNWEDFQGEKEKEVEQSTSLAVPGS